MAALAYVAAAFLLSKRAEREGLNPVHFVDLALVCGVAGFAGARLFHIIFEMPGFYLSNPLAIFKFWYGGFVLYGGVIVGVAVGLWYAHWRPVPVRHGADLVAPPLLLSIAIGRFGCYLAGCCYGRPTELAWPLSNTFHVNHGVTPQAQPLDTPLLPTQMACALLLLGCYALCIWMRPRKRFHGQLAATALIVYSIGRYMIEFMRADVDRGVYLNGWLSTSQIISVFVCGFGVVFWLRGSKKPVDASGSR